MADTSQAELPPQSNGLSDGLDDDDRNKMRPADIDADVREMERRKRVELIMNSKLFREELERIIEVQLKDGAGTTGLMQQISDMMGVTKNAGHVFKNSNCVVPINDIRGIEAMGYAKGEKILRCKLAAVYRLIDLYGWSQGCSTLITARLNQDDEHFLVNPYGMLFHEMTASSLIKVDMQGNVVEQGTTNFSVNIAAFSLHAAIHAARPDIKCIIHVHTPSVVAISALKCGLLPISEESVVVGDVSTHPYTGGLQSHEEIEKIARNLGPNNKVLLLSNQGAVCCGATIEEAFFNSRNTVLACESQLKLMPVGVDNLVLITDETRKKLYDAAHKAPESTPRPDQPSILEGKVERKWRVGGIEFEALMRMLDNAGFRTGYIYRHPLVKGEPPKPRNDVEVPPAVSSLGYLLEEEELYKQGLWKKLEGGRKGHDRSRWLNSPNVYQKVEILETGTPDPKKITKWVADGSPTHATSTPVKIESALQFVPKNTNPKEFKQLQQQIKDYRRADKISAGPQSHILEGVSWEEARKMQDATVTQTGDQVVLMGAASKGIIQRGFQHNATVYKSPYAKNPFDSVTDEELDEYKKVVEKKAKGEFDDTTDYSESEIVTSAQINKRISDIRSPTSVTSETEEESRDEPQVLRIQTTQAPKPCQPEVVLSDDDEVFEQNQQGENIIQQLKEMAIQQSPIIVHKKNNTSMNVVKAYRSKATGTADSCYRTNSYSGFPKGSYTIPNPTHFHIVRHTNTVLCMRPALVRIPPDGSAKYAHFNPNVPLRSNRDQQRPTVTINIGDTRSLTLNISMQTLREFIYPFAAALNVEHMSNQRTTSSQTSYHNENLHVPSGVSITELTNGYHKDSGAELESEDSCSDNQSEFEANILHKMHNSLLADVGAHDSSSDFDTSALVFEKSFSSLVEQNQQGTTNRFVSQNLQDPELHIRPSGVIKSLAVEESELDDSDICDAEVAKHMKQMAEAEVAKGEKLLQLYRQDVQLSMLNSMSHETDEISDTVPDNINLKQKILNIAEKTIDSVMNLSGDYSFFENVVSDSLAFLKQLPFSMYHTDHADMNDSDDVNEVVSKLDICESIDVSQPENTNENQLCLDRQNILEKFEEEYDSFLFGNSFNTECEELGENLDTIEGNESSKGSNVCDSELITEYFNKRYPSFMEKMKRPVDTSEELTTQQKKDTVSRDSIIAKFEQEYYSVLFGDNVAENTERIEQDSDENSAEDHQVATTHFSHQGEIDDQDSLLQVLGFKEIDSFYDDTLDKASGASTAEPNDDCPQGKSHKTVEDSYKGDRVDDYQIHKLASFNEDVETTIMQLFEDINEQLEIGNAATLSQPDIRYISEILPHDADQVLGVEYTVDTTDFSNVTFDKISVFEDVTSESTRDSFAEVENSEKQMPNDIVSSGTQLETLAEAITMEQSHKTKILTDNQIDVTTTGYITLNVEDMSAEKVVVGKLVDSSNSHRLGINDYDEQRENIENHLQVIENTSIKCKLNEMRALLEDLKTIGVNREVAGDEGDNIDDEESENNYEECEDLDYTDDNFEDSMDQEKSFEEFAVVQQQRFDEDIGDFFEKVKTGTGSQKGNKDTDAPTVVGDPSKYEQVEEGAKNEAKQDVSSCDEGISDCVTKSGETTLSSNELGNLEHDADDENITEMSDIIFKYLVQQCYEIKELVLFPEVLYDHNIDKMFASLRDFYMKHFTAITDEEKNELRLKIAYFVFRKIEMHDQNASTSDSDDSIIVSDKLFTISEFISDILDKFFERYTSDSDIHGSSNANWSRFTNSLLADDVRHSTPEKNKPTAQNDQTAQNTELVDKDHTDGNDEEVPQYYEKMLCPKSRRNSSCSPRVSTCSNGTKEDTTLFHAKKSHSGNELYWIAVNKFPKEEPSSPPVKRKIVNVDDIPLRPPADLTPYSTHRRHILSPILEEPRINNNSYEMETEEDLCEIKPQVNPDAGHCRDFLAGGDYFAFERPEVNVVVCDSVSFFRTKTLNAASFVKSSNVTFVREQKCNGRSHDIQKNLPNNNVSCSKKTALPCESPLPDNFNNQVSPRSDTSHDSYKSISQKSSKSEYCSADNSENESTDEEWMGYELAKF